MSPTRAPDPVLFEAQDRVGGQVVLAARASESQAELVGIVGWLGEEVVHLGVDLRLNTVADADDVGAENPDVVVTATGGWPDTSFLSAGEELVFTVSDVLAGHATVGSSVLIYDDNGTEPAPSVAEYLAERGVSDIELVTPDRLIGQDMAATTGPAYLRMLYQNDVQLTTDHQLVRVEPDGERLRAVLRNVFTRAEVERTVDTVVTEHGVVPNDDLYLALRDRSANAGEIDLEALSTGAPQPDPDSGYALYRVGDAVASRGIAAAIYEARRLCQNL